MSFLRPHKNHLQSRNAGLDQETAFESSVDVADSLKVLPLALTHTDINKMKLFPRRCGIHRGLIDWELAQLLPLGMNCSRIRNLFIINKNRRNNPRSALCKAKGYDFLSSSFNPFKVWIYRPPQPPNSEQGGFQPPTLFRTGGQSLEHMIRT